MILYFQVVGKFLIIPAIFFIKSQTGILTLSFPEKIKIFGGGSLPLRSPDVFEHPVPHDQEAGDHHIGEQSGTEEHRGDQHVAFHDRSRQGRDGVRPGLDPRPDGIIRVGGDPYLVAGEGDVVHLTIRVVTPCVG
jgi:hypothetical protein